MDYVGSLVLIAISAALINNFVLHYFLGICPFLGVSRRVDMAFGMGCAVTFVITIASLLSWVFTAFVLRPGAPLSTWVWQLFYRDSSAVVDLSILNYIVYIFVIASSVQFVEMFVERFSPTLYHALGIFLPLITVNCAILGASLFMITRHYGFVQSVAFGFGGGLGWMLAIVLIAGLRQKMTYSNEPRPFKGVAIVMIITGIMAMIFSGFMGMVKI